MPPRGRGLIVDASISRTVGVTDDVPAKRCRIFLEEMFLICHRLVVTNDLAAEWKEHASPFATRWLASMIDKRKIDEIESHWSEDLRVRISACARNEGERRNMLDDTHLIEAALGVGSPIVSLDNRARNCFKEAALRVERLRPVVWVNPTVDAESPLEWLRGGAPDEAARCLRFEKGQ